MSLQDKFAEINEQAQGMLTDKELLAAKDFADKLIDSGIVEKSIQVGDKLPSFNLENQNGEMVSSDELLKKGPLYISIFRGTWCPYCNAETLEIEDNAKKFRDAGASVVAIAPQISKLNKKLAIDNNLSFDLLADFKIKYGKKLGLKYNVSDYASKDYLEIIKKMGLNLADYNGYESDELVIAAKYVVDQDGKIAYAVPCPNPALRPEIDDALAVVKSLKS